MNPFSKGDTVRLKRDPKSIEKVGRVDDERVYVCFGFFTLAYRPEDLELVKPADLTNDAPRRRTEPAITVPPVYRWEDVRIGDVICDDEPESDGNMRVTRIVNDCVTVEVLRRPGVEQRWHRSLWEKASCVTLVARQHDPRPLWLPHQVESILQHGSAAYACMAADIEQCRELLAVEEAKAEMEAWRLSNADWLDHYCDSDATGDLARQGIEYREQFVDRWEAWLAALTPPAEGATLGDWAAAQPEPPMKWSREYMQHLYDKLAKDGGV